MSGLPIREVAERTGLAAGTIRMWEQRYGFPEPARTAAGYRLYSDADVEALRRVVELRTRGLSVPGCAGAGARGRGRDRPPVDLRRVAGGTSGARAAAAQADADRAVARDRGPDDGQRRRAADPRRLPARAQLPGRRAPLPADAERGRPGRRVRRLRAGASRRAGRSRCRSVRRGDRPRVGGGHRRARASPPACSRGSRPSPRDGRARPRPGLRDLWTLDPGSCAGPRWPARALAARDGAEPGERLEDLLRDRPLALEAPAPALDRADARIVGYLEG